MGKFDLGGGKRVVLARKLGGVIMFAVLLVVLGASSGYADPVPADPVAFDAASSDPSASSSVNPIIFDALLLALGLSAAHGSPLAVDPASADPLLNATNLANVNASVSVTMPTTTSLTYTFNGWCFGPGCSPTNSLASTGGHWIDLCYNANPEIAPTGISGATEKKDQTNKNCDGFGTYSDRIMLNTSGGGSNGSAITLTFPSAPNYINNALTNEFAVHVAFNDQCSGWISETGQGAPDPSDSCPAAIPEPSTYMLMGIGIVGLLGWVNRRRGSLL